MSPQGITNGPTQALVFSINKTQPKNEEGRSTPVPPPNENQATESSKKGAGSQGKIDLTA